MEPVETPYLIVGAGPAGASLACFLASYGLNGIVISMAPGTAKEPRAHITNAAALECLREIGLERACLEVATPQQYLQHIRWCHDISGVEFGRIYAFSNQPNRRGSYDAASPCKHVDLPQTLLEPILVGKALKKGWTIRYDTQFLSSETKSDGSIISTVQDLVSKTTYTIRSKYLFGCDGGRSQIVRELNLPLHKQPGQGLAFNLLVKADLTKQLRNRTGNIHWCIAPEIEHPPWAWMCGIRMVKPWHEWMFIILPEPGFTDFDIQPSEDEYQRRVRDFIGDDSVEFEILDRARWFINEIVAEQYSKGNVFCLGDAVHRHPPFNGLGSNTCIQDAYNLAWKVASVEKGIASTKLLETYSMERQPVGAGVVQRANQGLRDHVALWDALGVLPSDVDERVRQHAELTAATEAGELRRKKLREAIAYTEHEFGGLGIEMNVHYKSPAIYTADENEPRAPLPDDSVLHYQMTTYPGARLPHAWLNRPAPDVPQISTHDLAGHGSFCLFTGIGGEPWTEAVQDIAAKTSIPIKAVSIGWQQEYDDVYDVWARVREVDDNGAVLVRPDRIVCWRSKRVIDKPGEKLLEILRTVLGEPGSKA